MTEDRSSTSRRVQRARVRIVGCAFAGASLLPERAAAQMLLPPPPPPRPEQTQTEHQLERAEREDSGRGLQFVWLTPEVGFEWASLALLSDSDLFDGDLISGDSLGLVLGGGAGLRFLYFTGGARFRYGLLEDYHLMSVGLEGALRIPRGKVEPYAFAGAGYVRASNFEAEDQVFASGTRRDDLVASGFNLRLGGGLDYFVTPVFSAGARLEADVVFLSRPAVLQSGGGIYASDGSGIGLVTNALLVLGLHF